MGLKAIKQELKDNYISNSLTEKEFEQLFKEVMNSRYVKHYIESSFQEKFGSYLDERASKDL